MMFDGKAFGEEVVTAVKTYVDRETILLKEQNAILLGEVNLLKSGISELHLELDEKQKAIDKFVDTISKLEIPTLPDIPKMIEETIALHINYLSDSWADWQERSGSVIADRIKAYVADLPPPVDGKDGRDGVDGKSILLEDVQPFILAKSEEVFGKLEDVIKAIPVPVDGKDGRDGIDGKDGINGIDGKDGASITKEDVYPIINETIQTLINALPPPKDGIDGKDGTNGIDGKDGAPGIDGKSVTIDDVIPILKSSTDSWLSAIPIPKDGAHGKDGVNGIDGKSVTIEDVKPLIENEISYAVARIPPAANGIDGKDGKDGIGVAGVLVDREGHCVFTLSDGTMKDVGVILGKDGAPGLNGKDGAPGLDGKDGSAGLNGKDGLDGIGWDDMSAELRDDGLYLVWTKGDVIKEARVPSITYHDVWNADKKDYMIGQVVTWGGNMWMARKDNPEGKPEKEKSATSGSSKDWQLVVKKGRDGRDGRDGKDFTKPVKLEEK